MARERDVDWSSWKGHVEKTPSPLSRPLDGSLKKGADAAREALTTGNLPIMAGAPAQPTDEQMFGHLVSTEEQLRKAKDDWDNFFKNVYERMHKKVDESFSDSAVAKREWKTGKSFNSMLTEEELAKRNNFTGNDE